MLQKNVGQTDRVIRLIVGAVLLVGFFALSSTLAWVSLILGVVLLATAAMSSCGLYSLFGINTCPLKSD